MKKKTFKKPPAITSGSALKVHAQLKERHREIRDDQEYNLRMRVHRSLSWLERAMMCKDLDGKLIFLWIAFNSTYAKDSDPKEYNEQYNEQKAYRQFFKKLCELEKEEQINNLIWKEFTNSIRGVMDNQYICSEFWKYQRGKLSKEEWESHFNHDKKEVKKHLTSKASQKSQNSKSTVTLLSIVFSRIYVLRNQLVHGGATWGGDTNRDQIRDCARFMEKFVIAMLEILVEEKEFEWPPAPYPAMNKEK